MFNKNFRLIVIFLLLGSFFYFVSKKNQHQTGALSFRSGEVSDIVTRAKHNTSSTESSEKSKLNQRRAKELILDRSFDNPDILLKNFSGDELDALRAALEILKETPKAAEGSDLIREFDQSAIRAIVLIHALIEKSRLVLNADELQIIEDIALVRPNNQIKFAALEIFLNQKNSTTEASVQKILLSSEGAGVQLLMRLLLSYNKNNEGADLNLSSTLNQMVRQRSAAHALSVVSAVQPNDLSSESLNQLSQSACQNANLKIDRTLNKKIRTKLNILAEAQAMELQPCQ